MSDKFSFKKAIDPSEMPTRPEEERYNCKLGPGKTKLEKSEGEDEIYTRNEWEWKLHSKRVMSSAAIFPNERCKRIVISEKIESLEEDEAQAYAEKMVIFTRFECSKFFSSPRSRKVLLKKSLK
jgi:hypothetical protein